MSSKSYMFAKDSIMSGLLAATAATFGKVAFANDSFIGPFVASSFGAFDPAYCRLVRLISVSLVFLWA